MTTYSNSRISTYEQCPLKYRFQYIDRIKKDEEGIEAFVGNMVHKTLEEVVGIKKEFDRDITYEEAKDIYLRKWDENFHDEIVIVNGLLTVEDYRNKGFKCLRRYYDMAPVEEFGEVVGLELNLGFDIGEHRLGGFIDRLQRDGSTYHVIDYKTSRRPMTQGQADADRQLALYAVGVKEMFPDADDVQLHWFMLEQGELVSSRRTDDELEELKGEVRSIIGRIEGASEFLPSEGRLCDWCEYREECEAERKKRSLAAAGLGPPVEDLVEEYAELHARLQAAKSEKRELESRMAAIEPELIEIAGESDAWSIEGREHALDVKRKIGFYMPPKDSEDRETLEALVRDTGIWNEVSDISKSALLDALEKGKLGDRADEIRSRLEERKTFDFKPRNK